MKIPYADISAQHQHIQIELTEAFQSVLQHGKFILGPEVEQFEKGLAQYCQTEFAVGLNSGTDALLLAMKALGIGPGDEVIVPPNSYITSASSVVLAGATPVFVDVLEDFTINPELIAAAITSNTKAIIPVHLTGLPCDMSAISAIALEYGLWVIEDAAQAIGAQYNSQLVGSFGVAGCFSMHPLKTLNACGDAGAVVISDEGLNETIRCLRNNGMLDRSHTQYWSSNSRLDSIQAAVLLVKMKYLDEWTEKRINNAQYYFQHLADLDWLTLPKVYSDRKSVFHTFVIQTEKRNELRTYLLEKGIKTAIHYEVPIHLQQCSQSLGCHKGDYPVAEWQADRILSLPIHHLLTEAQLSYVVETIRNFI